MLYLVQRTDCDRFQLAADIDPAYAAAFDAAQAAGVERLVLGTTISPTGVEVGQPIAAMG
jgi:sugar fermentation stimulation protein A